MWPEAIFYDKRLDSEECYIPDYVRQDNKTTWNHLMNALREVRFLTAKTTENV